MNMRTHTVTVEPLGVEIGCRADQTVLDACLREGVWLPHACTHGTCGTCKVRIVDGELDLGDASPYALLDSERDEGAALICVAKPRCDVTVEGEVDLEEGVDVHPVRDYTGTVESVEDVAPEVRRLLVRLTEPLRFNAGQYIRLNLPDGGNRPYSVASAPSDGGVVELHVKRTPGGSATDGWIFRSLAGGDGVSLSGPYGRFSFRPARSQPVILLAGGTGLAPLKSIVKHLAETGAERDVVLYHGVATTADLYEHPWLEQFAAEHAWFDYRPALSREEYNGRTGRVPAHLAEDFPRAAGNVAYVCGSPPFVTESMRALMRARLFPRDIYREDFFDARDRAGGADVIRSPLIRR